MSSHLCACVSVLMCVEVPICLGSLLYHFLQFSFTLIPTYILLKTFLLTAANLLATSLFSVENSAQYVANGLVNVL